MRFIIGTVSFFEDDRLLQTMELIPNSTAQGDIKTGSKVSYTTTELSPGTHTYRYTCTLSEDAAKRYNLKNPAGPSATYTIIAKDSVTGIRIEAQPSKLNYTSGERLRINGLEVYLCYDDKEELLNNDLLTLSIPDGTVLTTANNNTPITITYAGFTAQTDPLTVTKNTPSVTAPTSNSLTYTGAAQELVSGGATTGGTLVYSLEQNGDYTETIPTGVNAGEYTVWYKVMGDEDYEGTEPSGPVTVTIAKADAAATVTPIEGLTYTSQPQALVTGTTTGGTLVYSLTGGDDYTAAIPTGTDVGDYTVWYKVNGGENYNDTQPASVSVSIGKAAATVIKSPQAVTGLTYDGKPHDLVTAGEATGGELQYSLSENNGYSTAIPTGTDVGTYTIWYKVVGDNDHSDTQPAAIKVTITGASIANAVVELEPDEFTYNGQSQTPAVTVKLDGKSLAEDTDYEVSYSDDTTNVGTVTVTVTGKGNYAGVAQAQPTYTITPAQISIESVTLAEKTYDGTTAATAASVTFSGTAQPAETDYTAAAEFDTADAGTNKTATITVTLLNSNYTFAGGKITAEYLLENQTIQKANYTGVQTAATGYVKADTRGSAALPAIPANASYGAPSGSDLAELKVENGVLTYTGSSAITENSQYTVTVQVIGDSNHNDYTITVTLTGTTKDIVTITGVAAATGLVYNGAEQTGCTGSPSAEGFEGTFNVTYNTADGKAPTDAGTYTVTIAIPESDTNLVGSLILSFTIERAPVTVTAPSKTIYVGDDVPELSSLSCTIKGPVGSDTFAGVTLTYQGTPSSSTAGSYAIVPSGGTFTTGDAGNYAVSYINGTLTVAAKSTPGGGTATGGGSSGSSDDDDDSTPATTVKKNSDGSTTITTTKNDGTVTETTRYTDGSKKVVETAADGTVTTTTTDADGSQTRTVESPDGSSETTVDMADGSGSVTVVDADGNIISQAALSEAAVAAAQAAGEPVALPMPAIPVTTDLENAPTVTVTLPTDSAVQVEIPVEDVTAGTVAVLVSADGSETVIKTSITTENGVAVTLSDGDTVKIVDNTKAFSDVPDGYWASAAINFVTSHELFAGTGANTFSPDTAMTRAMFVTVLARFEGVDTAAGATWYEAGQRWAMETGISDGSNMDASLTREQLATMLYRYAQNRGYATTQGGMAVREYADFEQISDYAVEAMTWAVNTGIINGTSGTTLSPWGEATRAQVAAILTRFLGE